MTFSGLHRSVPAAIASLVVASLLVSCGSGEQAANGAPRLSEEEVSALAAQERELGHIEQAEILADGVVSDEEYRAAFGLLAECVTSAGVQVDEPVFNPVSNDRYAFSYDFGQLARDVAMEQIDECEERFWRATTVAYSFTRTPHMTPELSAATRRCLGAASVSDGSEQKPTVRDLVDQLGEERWDEIAECISDSVSDLYPELKSISIGY